MIKKKHSLDPPRIPRTASHNHDQCIREALTQAEVLCDSEQSRLTPLRRAVFKEVWRHHRPVSAYDILDHMVKSGRRIAPPSIYRALEFLAQQGLVHRIETRNAYIGCTQPQKNHDACFMICRQCAAVEEIDINLQSTLQQKISKTGFHIETKTVELRGLCANCASESAT